MVEVIWGFAGSIVGTFLTVVVQHWLRERSIEKKARKGLLTGTWEQSIPPKEDQVAKRDRVECRQIGSEISGTIRRIEPPEQSSKSWEFHGIKRGSVVFLIFWSSDAKINPNSYGTIQMGIVTENHFRGFYIKRFTTHSTNAATLKWKQFDLEWNRITDAAEAIAWSYQ